MCLRKDDLRADRPVHLPVAVSEHRLAHLRPRSAFPGGARPIPE